MKSPTKGKTAPAKPAEEKTSSRKKGAKRKKVSALVEKVLGKIEQKIETDKLKPTVGDYLRLLQFREEIEKDEQPREIKVTWVESLEKKSEPET